MKKVVLLIGEELRLNRNFLDYIFRQLKNANLDFNEIKFINKIDKNLPNFIENLSNECEFLTIFTSNENYAIVGKILSTLTGDLLELRDETLAPSFAQKVVKNGFLLSVKNSQINVLKASLNEKLPQILTPCEQNSRIFYIFGYGLNYVKTRIEPLLKTYDISVVLSQFNEFLICVKAKENKFYGLNDFLGGVRKIFDNFVIDSENFIEFIARKLIQNNLKITFAESCTAGLIAAKFGEISGVSKIFEGSLITYSQNAKNAWLGVSDDTLANFGVYSNECVSEMIDGILKLSKADFAIAV
ncbi:MAG: CinA family protein, partial [Campylobacter sp.]|nr:CinA family protein [Campylobacter sp.]